MLSVAACFILAIDLGQTTKTRNPPSSNIHYRIRVGASWSRFSRKLHVESWFGAHFDFDFVCNNFKLPHQILSCYQLIWPYMLLCFFPDQEEPEEDGIVWCFQALETDGNKLHLKMYLGKTAWATCVGDTLENGTDEAIWIFHFLMMFNLNLEKSPMYILGTS